MTFVFRNNTIERFMPADYLFSGYDDISLVPDEATDFVWWYQVPMKFDNGNLVGEINSYINKIRLVLSAIGHRQFVVFTLVDICSSSVESGDFSRQKAIEGFNRGIYTLSDENPNVKVLDFALFTHQYSQESLIDWKLYMLSQTPINPKLSGDFKSWYAKQLRAVSLIRKKCLILDLDNTLWGGILGEDGVNNIQISGSYPGKAFSLWQQGLNQLKKDGVILCICSKNNMADVEEVWAKRDDMILKKDDFAAVRVNWQDKAANIRSLAEELNIGLDSMVFVDDNPAERELIRQQLPMVSVPDFPSQPYDLPKLYQYLVSEYFRIYSLTNEDRSKTEQYRQNAQRKEVAEQFTNMNDYLRSLQMVLSIASVSPQTISRAAQMTQKTNQFNLTTKRYTEADIDNFLNTGGQGWTISVADKFGDNGITGLVLVTNEGVIDTFLMSCRVLGKGIENVFLRVILSLLKKQGMCSVTGQYFPTYKNGQTIKFYPNNGFNLIESDEKGNVLYHLLLDNANFCIEDYFTIKIS